MGHHRFKIVVDAVIEAPAQVPTGQDPTEQSLTQTLKNRLLDYPVGGTYQIKVNDLKVKKGKAEATSP